ncbi:MAG: Na+/H+ antiporter [Pseudoxanthomonas sp.]|nr:Na+/H+ antiporter [Pseudoxanthomonas sp.]
MQPVEVFELVVGMFMAVLVLYYLALRLSIPPSVTLLVGGGALAFVPGLPVIELDPELMLVIFLPPLLADSAWFTSMSSFRRHLAGILSLAVGAVLFTTVVVAFVAKWLIPDIPWAACAALGAIISPPDAVSARAVLHRVKLPRRLNTLLEGESLLNDATGLVLVRFAVAAVVTGAFSAHEAALSFSWLIVGGILVGATVAGLWRLLVHRLRDDRLMVAASTLLCWVAYLAGERLHVSGVIATVVAGLICGWYQHVIFTGGTRISGTASWKSMIFMLEAAVFILIGFSLRGVLDRAGGLGTVIDSMGPIILAIVAAMTAARFAWIFGSDVVIQLLRTLGLGKLDPLGPRAATVLSWAGMRGVVTLAFALTLPEVMPGRDLMLVTAFTVILLTVLVQGTTLGLLIQQLKPAEDARAAPPLDLAAAEALVANAQFEAVKRHAYSPEGKLIHPQLLERYERRASAPSKFAGTQAEREQHIAAHFDVILASVAAGRAELVRLHRQDQIEDETLHDLEHDLDLEELSALAAKGQE